MIAYKGFEKNLSCRGYQFNDMGSMRQRRQIADKMDSIVRKIPLDCLVHYPNWRNSRYFVVKAFGDLDEDDRIPKSRAPRWN